MLATVLHPKEKMKDKTLSLPSRSSQSISEQIGIWSVGHQEGRWKAREVIQHDLWAQSFSSEGRGRSNP